MLLLCILGAAVTFCYGHQKYPNEIAETPVVECDANQMVIKIKTTATNPSNIYAEDFREKPQCHVRNKNKITIPHDECGMMLETMNNPDGSMYRVCVVVQMHPLFVTESDRLFCAQCVYMDTTIVNDLQQNIAISEAQPSELEPQFDESSNPKCTYTIRKNSVDGPEIHFATIGQPVFHVWHCENDNVGILVRNCHVEDLEGNKILIIDNNGCALDQYVLQTPIYTEDMKTAYQEAHVFKFAEKTMTRFSCQIQLCLRNRSNTCSRTPLKSCPNDTPGILNTTQAAVISSDAAVVNSRNTSDTYNYRTKRQSVEEITAYGSRLAPATRQRRMSSSHDQSSSMREVIGVLRVLDSDEDARYYEARLRAPAKDIRCLSTNFYWSLVATLGILIFIQLTALLYVTIDKCRRQPRDEPTLKMAAFKVPC